MDGQGMKIEGYAREDCPGLKNGTGKSFLIFFLTLAACCAVGIIIHIIYIIANLLNKKPNIQ